MDDFGKTLVLSDGVHATNQLSVNQEFFQPI